MKNPLPAVLPPPQKKKQTSCCFSFNFGLVQQKSTPHPRIRFFALASPGKKRTDFFRFLVAFRRSAMKPATRASSCASYSVMWSKPCGSERAEPSEGLGWLWVNTQETPGEHPKWQMDVPPPQNGIAIDSARPIGCGSRRGTQHPHGALGNGRRSAFWIHLDPYPVH